LGANTDDGEEDNFVPRVGRQFITNKGAWNNGESMEIGPATSLQS
jgi:hypothetical protein